MTLIEIIIQNIKYLNMPTKKFNLDDAAVLLLSNIQRWFNETNRNKYTNQACLTDKCF